VSGFDTMGDALSHSLNEVTAVGMRHVAVRRRWLSLRLAAPLALGFGTITMVGYAVSQGSLAVLMAYLLFGLMGLALAWWGGGSSVRIYITVYGLAAAAAAVLAWIFSSSYGVPYWNGGSDELHYEAKGLEFAQRYGLFDYGAIRGNIVHAWHNSVGYIYLVGLLAKFSEAFGGFHTMVPRLFNAMCLALISVLIFSMGLRLGMQKKTAVAAALFAGCLPLMMWVSVQTLRDIVVTLLLVSFVFLWLPDQRGKWRYAIPVMLILSILLLLPLWEMRKAQAFVAVLLMGFAILLNRDMFKPRQFIFLFLPIFWAGLYLVFLFYNVLIEDVLHMIGRIDTYAELRGEGGTGGGLSLVVFETPLFPIGWSYRTIYALVSPLPVSFRLLDLAWLSLGTIIHILFIPFLWMGLRRAIGNSAWRHIVIAFVLLFIGMAMFTFTARHIAQYLPFAILLAALGFERYLGNPWLVWITMAGVGSALAGLYIVLKIL